jgi:hypothetical protein
LVKTKKTIEEIANSLLGTFVKYSHNDKLKYLQIKFTAFVVELNFIFNNKKQLDFGLFQNFLNQVCTAIVECLVGYL